MANITTDIAEISYAESVTNWSGDTFSLENQSFVQGSNSVACIQTNNGSNLVTYTPTTALNMVGKHIRIGFNSNIIVANGDTEASNGVEVVVTHTNGTARFTITGSDTYKGGWQDYFFDIHATPTSGTAYTTGTVSVVTLQINTNTKPRNTTNGWYDNWRFGNGLTINSTTTEAVSFQDVADIDVAPAQAYGILQDTDGVLFCGGSLTLGSTGTANCNFVSSGETIYFLDRNVASDLYKIVSQESTGATDIDISGLTCKTVGTTGAELDFSVVTTSCSVVSSSFTGMGLVKFHLGATVTGNTFTNCGAMTHGGSTFEGNSINTSALVTILSTGTCSDNTFNKASGTSAVSVASLDDLDNNTFISDGTGHAVTLTSIGSGSMSWGNNDSGYASIDGSTGNETIYVNVASGNLTINVDSGYTTPTIRTAGAVVTVVSGQVTFTLTVKDTSGTVIQGAMVYVEADTGGGLTAGTVIINKLTTDVNGQVSDTRSLGSNQPIVGRVRKSTSAPYYKTTAIVGTINSASGLDLTVQMIDD